MAFQQLTFQKWCKLNSLFTVNDGFIDVMVLEPNVANRAGFLELYQKHRLLKEYFRVVGPFFQFHAVVQNGLVQGPITILDELFNNLYVEVINLATENCVFCLNLPDREGRYILGRVNDVMLNFIRLV